MKRVFTVLVLLIMCLLHATGIADTVSFAGGDGSSSNPYQIATVGQLNAVRDHLNSHFILCSNIDLSSIENWTPIGSESKPFTGTFNGNGYRISNITINRSVSTSDLQAGNVDIGFFGYTSGATITKLGIEEASYQVNAGNFSAEVYSQVGGIAGTIKNTTISQCYFTGNIENNGGSYVLARSGGIAAIGLSSTVSDCYVNANISGYTSAMNVMVAGLIPWLDKTNVERCYVAGKVTSDTKNGYSYAGGIHASGNADVWFGYVFEYCGTVKNCVVVLEELSATGASVIKNDVGYYSEMSNNKVLAHNSSEARSEATYKNLGWDFKNVWIINQAYPTLIIYEVSKNDTYRFEAYGSRPNYGVEINEEIRILISLYKNGNLFKTINGYSIENQNDDIVQVVQAETSEEGHIFTFKGLTIGTTYITFSENDTGTSLTVPIEVIDKIDYYRCSVFPGPFEYENLRDLYIPKSGYTCTELNGKHTIEFDVYNRSHAYGIVEVWDKNNKICIRREVINPWPFGSGIEMMYNAFRYVVLAFNDQAWYEKYSEHTHVILENIPEDAEIIITTDANKSEYIALYTAVDLFVKATLTASHIADIPAEAQKDIVNALIQAIYYELGDDAIVGAIEELGSDLLLSLTQGISKESSTRICEKLFNTFQNLNISYVDIIETTLNGMGYSMINKIVSSLDPVIEILFVGTELIDITFEWTDFNTNLYKGAIEINAISHNGNNTLIDNSVIVSQNDFFNIDTILDVYLVIENEELQTFPNSLTADMLKYCIYNITLRENGKEIQPSEELTVRIPIPDGVDGEKCVVYRLENDGTRTLMPATLDGKYMVFKTSHLSYYLIGELKDVEPNMLSGTVNIIGDAVYGEMLNVSVSNTNNTGVLNYTWKRDSSAIATGETYTLTKEDIGKNLTCEVTSSIETGSIVGVTPIIAKQAGPAAPTNLIGVAPTGFATKDGKIIGTTVEMELATDSSFTSPVDCSNGETTGLAAGIYYVRYKETDIAYVGEVATVTVPEFVPNTLTGTVTITGRAVYGQTLTASVSDTNNTGVLTYTWKRDGSVIATGESYTLTALDIGKSLTCEVTSSIETGSIVGVMPIIAKQTGPAAPTNLTGVAPTGFTTKDGKIVGTTAEMEFAVDNSFTSPVDCGNGETTSLAAGTYYVRYKETDTSYAGEAAAVIVPEFVPNTLTGTVTITGNAVYGQTLTASLSNTNNTGVLTYSWKRDGGVVATGESYTLTVDDVSKIIICEVTSSVETGSIAGATEIVAKQSAPAAPTGLTGIAPTSSANSDGRITGTSGAMEYALSVDFADAKSCGDGETISLIPGTYYVRIRETSTTEAGEYVIVVVPEYVKKSPVIQYPENDQTVNVEIGNTANMSVMADYAVSYQWFVDRNDGKGFVEISGATSAVYTTAAVKAENNGYRYFCRVSNADGYVDSPIFTLQVIQTVNLPDTGDHSRLMLWMLMAALSIAVITLMSRKNKTE